ncbi:hypothetical protein BC628DRAFT_636661 [Trametes gibbosa]|nr:hypothetical protein BC628DRAFT_636661 [Trametes gibbosa]
MYARPPTLKGMCVTGMCVTGMCVTGMCVTGMCVTGLGLSLKGKTRSQDKASSGVPTSRSHSKIYDAYWYVDPDGPDPSKIQPHAMRNLSQSTRTIVTSKALSPHAYERSPCIL